MGPEHISIFLLVFMFTEVPIEAVGALDEQDYDLKKKSHGLLNWRNQEENAKGARMAAEWRRGKKRDI